ncbi:ParB N-terminal domain-containing protein [Methylobacterium nodulans]|uniref:ParB domain protein nuclease n=1 Tax=Methylobacterium nodulans (strain LMG 21967 / CNCM I-2342 / ORS 2060) TaxID=460265 RepID=B8IHN6_METNO|nr:ParB N-terminal domain-containing protein [Methylobacterium nodulans]ACL61699.1 ParB domain protein nuclease [Methylobacterium nodulans ORS 2060]
MSTADLHFISPHALRPTEEICPDRVREVVDLIVAQQAWTQPICVERTTLALLDGHHRRAAAIQLGLTRVPVRVFDYEAVDLASWRADVVPTREEVLRRARDGQLYPPKTTRHAFGTAKPVSVKLAQLL